MLVADLLAHIERLAPFGLAEPWDKVGLQVGSLQADVHHVLVALDPSEGAIDEAVARGSDVLLTHHPLLFDPVAAVTDQAFPGSAVVHALREGLAVIVAHTNLDKTRDGLADIVVGALALEEATSLLPAQVEWCKLVGFVPEGDAETVRRAVFAAGAGVIGGYVHCSFSIPGQGTFLGTEGTRPAVGTAGSDQTTSELRLEAVFPRAARRAVLDAYVAAHSYEEPAFDVYPLENEVGSQGLGRVGYLKTAKPLGAVARTVAGMFGMSAVRFTGDPERVVRRVACVPGSGASLIAEAAGAADVLVTGDIKYHDAERASRLGLALIDVPHEVSEGFALERWCARLADTLKRRGVGVDFFPQPRRLWHQVPVEVASAEPVAERAQPTVDAGSGEDGLLLYVDGGARGNPGPAAIGGRLLSAGGELQEEFSDRIGEATNNVAEYQALITGLELALDRGVRKLTVFSDSELIVKQVHGEYKVKDAVLKTFHEQVHGLLLGFREVELKNIRREENAAADRLVNEALDRPPD